MSSMSGEISLFASTVYQHVNKFAMQLTAKQTMVDASMDKVIQRIAQLSSALVLLRAAMESDSDSQYIDILEELKFKAIENNLDVRIPFSSSSGRDLANCSRIFQNHKGILAQEQQWNQEVTEEGKRRAQIWHATEIRNCIGIGCADFVSEWFYKPGEQQRQALDLFYKYICPAD